jgi:peptidyl-tRNA hydrolase
LYVVSRGDLSLGTQATQAVHAAFTFAMEHPILTEEWYRDSSYLVLVAVPDEESLTQLLIKAREADLVTSIWREPDKDNEMTAIALEPGRRATRLCANLPLLLREMTMVTGQDLSSASVAHLDDIRLRFISFDTSDD